MVFIGFIPPHHHGRAEVVVVIGFNAFDSVEIDDCIPAYHTPINHLSGRGELGGDCVLVRTNGKSRSSVENNGFVGFVEDEEVDHGRPAVLEFEVPDRAVLAVVVLGGGHGCCGVRAEEGGVHGVCGVRGDGVYELGVERGAVGWPGREGFMSGGFIGGVIFETGGRIGRGMLFRNSGEVGRF